MSQSRDQERTGSFGSLSATGATVPVSVFNANTQSVQVVVNNGASFTIDGASGPNYTPQLPTKGGPSFTLGGPAQNTFGIGQNQVQITPTNSIISNSFTMTLPASINYVSLQLYIFFATVNSVSWVLLQNGQIIAQNESTL